MRAARDAGRPPGQPPPFSSVTPWPDLVIVGPCFVVSGGRSPQVLEDGGVRVVGAHIAQVARIATLAASHPEETLWPAGGRVLMPGLVNAHAHLARHLARGLALATRDEWRRYDDALAPEDIHW